MEYISSDTDIDTTEGAGSELAPSFIVERCLIFFVVTLLLKGAYSEKCRIFVVLFVHSKFLKHLELKCYKNKRKITENLMVFGNFLVETTELESVISCV